MSETNPGSKEVVGPALEPCPLSHYAHVGLRAYKTGLDPRIVCLDCGLTLRAPDWIKVYERWQSRTRVPADSAGAMVDNASLKKLARRLIDAVINSPCVIEVRMFSQPEAVENLEDKIVKLMAAAPLAPKEEEAPQATVSDTCRCGHSRWDHWGWGNFACSHGDCAKFNAAPLVSDCDPDN